MATKSVECQLSFFENLIFSNTRSYAALRAADLDWIIFFSL